MQTLKGKTAVITGGANGIGLSIALALADAGTHVVIADIQEGAAQTAVEAVRARGVRSLAVTCDVSDSASMSMLADKAYAELGCVDILCNNAGVTWRPYRSILEATLDDWRFFMGINVWGVVHGLDAFLPRMRQQAGEKHIVNTASIGGLLPMEGHALYTATKAAVAAFSEAIAGELAPFGFGVTILCPGPIPTKLIESAALIRGESPHASQRQFEPVATPTIDRMAAFSLKSADTVGPMVRNAILNNTLYLHTAVIPGDIVADRVSTLFGSSTLGKVDLP